MSALVVCQAEFLRAVLDADAPLPEGWGARQSAGLAVYRGNYRSAVIGALESIYERTARLVGPKAFRQAAINHAIAHPSGGWSIDSAGEGFAATLAEFLPERPEAAETAWLEWQMLEISAVADCEPMTVEGFAEITGGFADADWLGLRLQFQPRLAVRTVAHDLASIWRATKGTDPVVGSNFALDQECGCVVWREGERPVFRLIDLDAAAALGAMVAGGTYGEAIVALAGDGADGAGIADAASRAGAQLGEWLRDGLVRAAGD